MKSNPKAPAVVEDCSRCRAISECESCPGCGEVMCGSCMPERNDLCPGCRAEVSGESEAER